MAPGVFLNQQAVENAKVKKALGLAWLGLDTEDKSVHEGTVTYDIRFRAIAPGSGEPIGLIVNVEAQIDFYPGYPLTKRGIYYCCRMISSQYGREFIGSHYEKLKKVYSIWICMIPPTETLEREVHLMCNLSQGVLRRGMEKGRAEGIIESIRSLMANTGWTLERAMEALGIPEPDRPKYAGLLRKQ